MSILTIFGVRDSKEKNSFSNVDKPDSPGKLVGKYVYVYIYIYILKMKMQKKSSIPYCEHMVCVSI